MRLRTFFSTLILALCVAGLNAQVTLFSEDFNGCALPPGWEVNKIGNQNPVWYVGISQNDDALGESIDSTCFLFIDDDETGNNTAGYVIEFISPPFDASQHSTVTLTMDVHYRDWDEADESLQILLKDGATEMLISRFDDNLKNGEDLADHFSLQYDLALLTNSPNIRLAIRYDDSAGDWNWWAGVDNIKIVGSGTGTNVITETFNSCSKPTGWETQIVTGQHDWQFGLIQQGSNALGGGNSMDGSCFAYFDDDAWGEDAPFSNVRLISPWFDGAAFANFELNFDAILRYYKETLAIIVQNGNGEETLVRQSGDDIGGPYFPDYVHAVLDLSPYRSQQMRVIFEYDDGKDWGWWVGIDNVKITGSGEAFDICNNATQLLTGEACKSSNNLNSLFDGPPATCAAKSVAGLWYRWQADFFGTAKFTTNAQFNDVVSIFNGTCGSLQPIMCDNRDEHGFTGEAAYFPVENGTQYLIRVSGIGDGFGIPRSSLCVEIDQSTTPAPPPNDDCANAINLTANGNCPIGSNINAATSPTLPSLNLLARADVWYSFVAENLAVGEKLEIQSNASFSDIITVYKGSCDVLEEVIGTHHGGNLELPLLTAGETYFVQIAGNFATVEGGLCPQLLKKQENTPQNDNCVSAISVPVGGQCVAATNLNATFSGYLPLCAPSVDHDIWFKFTATSSGSVRINTGAEFEHTLAVWESNCNNLKQVFCAENPLRCDGYISVLSLEPGQTYYVQIASRNSAAGIGSGEICLKILDGLSQPDFQPLAVTVKENCVSNGAAELQVTTNGGVQPYDFLGNMNGEVLLSGTSYLVVVTDAMGCEKAITGIVDDCASSGCALAATILMQPPKCFGDANGALAANPTAGVPPLQYIWSNGETTQTISNLVAGIYSLTITDASNCQISLSQTLIEPAALSVTPTAINPKCFGDPTGLIATSTTGGATPYQYLWSNNATMPIIEGLTAGIYTLTLTDANGCTSVVSQTLTEPPAILVTLDTISQPTQGQSDGSISVAVTGGTGQYGYTWFKNDVLFAIGLEDLAGIPAGNYRLEILDANGCIGVFTYNLTETVGIKKPDEAFYAEIFPNPAKDNATLAVAFSQPQSLMLSLVDAGGRTLRFWAVDNVTEQHIPLNFKDLPSGVYLLRILAGKDVVGKKVVKGN